MAVPAGAIACARDVAVGALSDLRPLGQIHDSFIIAAGRDGLWIIDQHVAHERILFEQVLTARRRQSGSATAADAADHATHAGAADRVRAHRRRAARFGLRDRAVRQPHHRGEIRAGRRRCRRISRSIFRDSGNLRGEMRSGIVLDDLRRGMAASIACRAAIKINMRLEPAKMDWLLRALAATIVPMSCPHGRPIALRYSTRDILKGFTASSASWKYVEHDCHPRRGSRGVERRPR